ncbi:NifU family protein [Rickettsiales bacterium]|nr:NifU family protein [Rickettsiales bacterium]MDB2550292.1 NifU family protein [Rickettsiales bacterium]
MFIQIEDTPNPESLKFIPDDTEIAGDKISEYKNLDEAKLESPLAEKFFEIEGVKTVFLGKNFITITKTGNIEWQSIKTDILSSMMDFINSGQEVFYKKNAEDSDEEDSDIVKQIKELIEMKVRPAVAMDGGDIIFHSFENGIVFLSLRGACSGCPSSTVTLKNGIENMLKHYIPEVESVEQIAQ